MNEALIDFLKAHQADRQLGHVVKQALLLIESAPIKSWDSPGDGQSSHSLAKTYQIRMSHKTYSPERFLGLEESISTLKEDDVLVHLSVIETEKNLISIWRTHDSHQLKGLVIGSS
jgi:hypothetical protein